MQKIIWLDSAVEDLVRLREFIATNNATAAKKASEIIKKATSTLEKHPNTGKPVSNLPDYRDLYIKFGAAGYVMRYRIYDVNVYIVHIRHYREKDFNLNIDEK